jgi:hypothetical protein
MLDKLNVTTETGKHGSVFFSYTGVLDVKQAFELQRAYGNHPHGYGLYNFKVDNGVTTWSCSNSCD